MASGHQSHPPTSCGYTRNYCSCGCGSNQFLHCCESPLPSVPPPTDPRIQALAFQLLQSNPAHVFPNYPNLYPQNPHPQFPHSRPRLHNHEPFSAQEGKTHFVISSLLGRIEALEASLYHFSSHCSGSSSSSSSSYSHSIRDLAACVIQRHFRAFLVRRSRTLWQLKELAMIKSAFSSLKSNQTHFDFQILSRKATALLLKLDSIKGSDRMVRDGKRSISRDLIRFLDFIDGLFVKRLRATRIARHDGNCDKPRVPFNRNYGNLHDNQREIIRKLKDRVENIHGFTNYIEDDEEDVELERFEHVSDEDDEVDNPKTVINGKNGRIKYKALIKRQEVQPKVKKRVSFAEERNMSMVLGGTYEPISHGKKDTCLDDCNSSDDHEELVENLCNEVKRIKSFSHWDEEDDDEAEVKNADISKTSYEGRSTPIIEGSFENRDSVFSAPLPVQIEAKADLLKRRNKK